MTAAVTLRPVAGETEFPALVAVWSSAVRATHDFLAETDFEAIEAAMPQTYLPSVDVTVAESDGRIVGFSGLADGRLEMLFVDADVRGSGVGTLLLDAAIQRHPDLELDVNEQNSQAVAFYLRRGFVQVGRSELDGGGRPYPLLTLSISSPITR